RKLRGARIRTAEYVQNATKTSQTIPKDPNLRRPGVPPMGTAKLPPVPRDAYTILDPYGGRSAPDAGEAARAGPGASAAASGPSASSAAASTTERVRAASSGSSQLESTRASPGDAISMTESRSS